MMHRFFTYLSVLFIYVLLSFQPCQAQEEFFRSKQVFSPEQGESGYAAVTVTDSMLFFMAADYKLYTYQKTTGELRWSRLLNYRSRSPCFAAEGSVYVPYYTEKQSYTARLDQATGEIIRVLPVGPLQTKPILRNGILYGTAIYEAGNIFSYDLKADSLRWWKFIAHGMSNQPYYFKDRIVANAESDNWFELTYDGVLRDTSCKQQAEMFVPEIPCIENYIALAHDRFPLDKQVSDLIFGEDELITLENTLWGKDKSFILADDKLAIIGSKGKLLKTIDVRTLLRYQDPGTTQGLTRLLLADQHTIQFMYEGQLVHYDFRKQKLLRVLDLSAWKPRQVVLEPGKIWLISGKDGLLYGLSIAG